MRWSTFKKMVMLEQTVFGLTWVLAAALLPLADAGTQVHWAEPARWLALVAAFLSARVAGMAFNRIIDRDIDAANPRTKDRVLPSGEASLLQVKLVAALSSFGFVGACASINPILAWASPFLLLLIYVYAYTKRFTSLCHFVMGLISGLGPVCAWAAMTDSIALAPVLMGLAPLCYIAALDIIYALQDFDYDAAHGLHSIPVRLGRSRSVYLSRVLHACTVLALMLVGLSLNLHWTYYCGIVGIAGLLVFHHASLRPSHNTWIYRSFFAVNARVGIAVLFIVVEVLAWGVMS